MYIIVSVNYDTTNNSATYTSNAGHFLRPIFNAGSVANCSELSATLHAVVTGLKRIQGQFGIDGAVSVMVPTSEVAAKLTKLSSGSLSTRVGDDKELWAAIAVCKSQLTLSFGSCLRELPELATAFNGWTAGLTDNPFGCGGL